MLNEFDYNYFLFLVEEFILDDRGLAVNFPRDDWIIVGVIMIQFIKKRCAWVSFTEKLQLLKSFNEKL